jgi:hypothetical protein
MDAQAGPNVAELLSHGHHQPMRPTWDCDTCGAEWPCAPAREHVLTSWTLFARGLTMHAYFEEACQELEHAPAKLMWRRFLGWIRDDQPDSKGHVPWT